jgi:hypothetical protein
VTRIGSSVAQEMEDMFGGNRLGEDREDLASFGRPFQQQLDGGMSGNKQELALRVALPHPMGEFNSRPAWKHDIGDDRAQCHCPGQRNPILSAVSGARISPCGFLYVERSFQGNSRVRPMNLRCSPGTGGTGGAFWSCSHIRGTVCVIAGPSSKVFKVAYGTSEVLYI